jgi:UDP-N-acetylglucosamine acyltransferase
MAYAHVAHDCQLEEGVIMANQATLGGHVEIGRHAIVSGLTAVHQFVRIGAYAFVGGCSGVNQDIPPYLKVQGAPAKPFGLNAVGLRRHGFSHEAIHALKEAYRIVFLSDLNTSQALERMKRDLPASPEIERFIDFIQRSQRGISK